MWALQGMFLQLRQHAVSSTEAHQVGVALGQLVAALEEALGGLLQRGVGHQLLLPELGEVDDPAQVRPEPRRLRLVQILPRM